MKPAIFTLLFVTAFSLFGWSVRRLFGYLWRGRHHDPFPRFDRPWKRLGDVLVYFLGQKKVVEPVSYDAAGRGITSFHHLFIFWGFLVIQVGALEIFLQGFSGDRLNLSFLGPAIYHPLKLLVDWFDLVVLLMIGYAFFRRLVLRPRLIPINLDASLILGMIGLLMVTHFGHHALQMAAEGIDPARAATFSALLVPPLASPGSAALLWASQACWWLHVLTIFVFLNYIPYSKHIHLLGSLPNIALRNLDARIVGTRRNLEDEGDYGAGRIEQFTWKQLLDGYACTECARCSNFCPAFNTDKPLSPFAVIQDLKHEMIERGALQRRLLALRPAPAASTDAAGSAAAAAAPGGEVAAQIAAIEKQLQEMEPLVGGRIKDEVLWSCTTCGACQEVCPVFIEHPRAIVDMRTHLVLSESRMPPELGRMFTNLERNSNPWGMAADKRMDWAEGLAVPTVEDKPDAEYLLFVGCAGAFDDRIKRSMRALVECLQAAEVSFAVLGPEEQCSGDPSRRGGNEFLYQMQAQANVDAMNAAKVTKVVASCPHCFHTIKNEYPAFGGRFEVIHHSQLLAHLLSTGRLKPEHPVAGKYTYHDSCYLGRWNGEYGAPRQVITAVAGAAPLAELARNKEHGFCCGGGGARMWMEEKIGTRVNRNRSAEVIATGAEVAAVACPFCTIMLEDGVKDAGAEERVQVLDLAEVVAKSLRRKAELGAAPPPPAPAGQS